MRCKLLVILLFVAAAAVHASDKVKILPQPGWLYLAKDDVVKEKAPKNVSDGYYIEFIDHQVNLTNNTIYTHFIRHIVNESGVQNAAEISVTFSPAFQQVVFHAITVMRDGKIVSRLTADQVKVVQEETDASDYQYNGLKRAFVMLKDVRKNDRIEASYSVAGVNPVFDNKYCSDIYFSGGTFVGNYFYTIIAPSNRKLFIRTFNNAPEPAIARQDNLTIYHWNNPSLTMWESQPGVPSWFDNYPYVSISEYNGLPDVVNWGLKIFNHYKYPLSDEIKQKIEDWKKMAQGDKDLYANLAVRFVQDQVRYLGLEMGTYTHQPHNPSEVFHHRFGDCKDKALLLVMLLRENDIDASVALVNSGSGQKLATALPSTENFDHAIVAIKRSMEYAFIDATISFQRGELMNLYIPGYAYALVIKEGENKLQPVLPGAIFSTTIDETLDVSSKDTNSLIVQSVYKGGMADEVRKNNAEVSPKELAQSCTQYYSKLYNGIQLIDSVGIIDDSTKNQVTTTESYTFPTVWHLDGKGREAIEIFAKPIYEDIPDPATVFKNAPVEINFPLDKYYTLKVIMPDDWTFPFDAVHIKNDSYQFDFVPATSGKIITLSYHIKTFKDHIPVELLAAYKEEYKNINDILDFSLFYNANLPEKNPERTIRNTQPSNINWTMVIVALTYIAALVFFLYKVNRRSAYVQYTAGSGWPIGGWVVVLGITIGLAVILRLINFTQINYYKQSLWTSLGEAGGTSLQYVVIAEMLLNLTWLGGAIALLVWFLKRRDIFPITFIWYIGSLLAGQLLMIVVYSIIKYPASYGSLAETEGIQLFRTMVYAAIWVTYVIRSERVKNTFLQPHA